MNEKTQEIWIIRNWHPLVGLVYLFICLCDFVFMPLYYQWMNSHLTATMMVMLANKFTDPASQIQALTLLHSQMTWVPLTLQDNGLFHIAFGVILTSGIITTNRISSLKQFVSDVQQEQQLMSSLNSLPNTKNKVISND